MVYCLDHSSTLPAPQARMEGNAGWAGADHSSTLPALQARMVGPGQTTSVLRLAPQAHVEGNAGWKRSTYVLSSLWTSILLCGLEVSLTADT